jgi:predicted metalloprotease with PDZ domain
VRAVWSTACLLVVLAAADAPAAGRSPAIRVHVSAAEGAVAGLGESVRDVKQVLLENVASSRLQEAPMSDADLMLVLNNRHTGLPPVHSRGTDLNAARIFYTVSGVVIDARRQPRPMLGRGVVWRVAAADLLRNVEVYAKEQEHALLRRRADWPAVGFDFEPLTKELERELGTKGGAVVVTAVTADTPASRGGLQVGDALLKLEGRKLESAGDLARALYAATPGAALQVEAAQKGARRTVTLSLP